MGQQGKNLAHPPLGLQQNNESTEMNTFGHWIVTGSEVPNGKDYRVTFCEHVVAEDIDDALVAVRAVHFEATIHSVTHQGGGTILGAKFLRRLSQAILAIACIVGFASTADAGWRHWGPSGAGGSACFQRDDGSWDCPPLPPPEKPRPAVVPTVVKPSPPVVKTWTRRRGRR